MWVFVWAFWLHHTVDSEACSFFFQIEQMPTIITARLKAAAPFQWSSLTEMADGRWTHIAVQVQHGAVEQCTAWGEGKNPKVRIILHISWHECACCTWNSNLIQWYKCYLTKTFLTLLYLDSVHLHQCYSIPLLTPAAKPKPQVPWAKCHSLDCIFLCL